MMQQLHKNKVLHFTFTLLCLVCIASSQSKKEQLDMIKDNIQQGQQNLSRLKGQLESTMNNYEKQEKMYRNILETIQVPPGDELLNNVKDSMDKTKADLNAMKEKLQEQIYEVENELKYQRKMLLKFFPMD